MRRRGNYKKRSKQLSILSKKVRMFSFGIVSIVISTLVLLGFSFYKFLNAPFSNASNIVNLSDSGVWQDDFTNILLIRLDDKNDQSSNINSLAILHINNELKRYDIYKIPVDIDIEYGLNFGRGKFSDIYRVGNSDQGRGIYLISQTILKNLAVSIDGYVAVDSSGYEELVGIIGGVDENELSVSLRIKNYLKLPGLIGRFRSLSITNLTISDVFSVLGFIKNTSEGSGTVSDVNLYQVLDFKNWDSLWQSKMDFSSIQLEPVKVFVLNASSDPKIPGLASWGARVIKNLGGFVLETQNSFVDFDENTIITDNKDSVLVQKLSKAFRIKRIILVDEVKYESGINQQVFRTGVSVVLTRY